MKNDYLPMNRNDMSIRGWKQCDFVYVSGDAYVAGVLFGLLKYGDPQKAMQFGNATSSVKNTVPGDLPSSDFKEIDRIIREHNATGPVSEMNR
jgi:2-dehydro-3-deoxygluconokinase